MDNSGVIEEFRQNAGKVGGYFKGMELMLLTVTGAKSGKKFTKPLAFSRDGDKYVVIASMGGSPIHPAWYFNLRANPEAEAEIGTDKFKVKAHEADPAERDRLYAQHANLYPGFWDYKKKTTREIPVFTLEKL